MISVVIPIYNQELYLAQCINSVISQSYNDLEIILVDDGSTDGSVKICEAFKKEDRRIKIVNKENGGVSSARNEGIKNSQGEWILFVDADDYLKENILEKIISEVKGNREVELFLMNYYTFTDNKIETSDKAYINELSISGSLSYLICYKNNQLSLGSSARACWGKLFKTEIIKKNNISFKESLYIGEDMLFVLNYIKHTKSIKVLDEYGYYYRVHEESVMQSYKKDLYKQYVELLNELIHSISDLSADCQSEVSKYIYYFKLELYIGLCKNAYGLSVLENKQKIDFKEANEWFNENVKYQITCKKEISVLPKLMLLLHCTKKILPGRFRNILMSIFLKMV
ncbi:MAG: glycosyltransferase [Erysipelotrichaceae bacterium]